MDKLDKLANILCQKSKIALICHINPDGDTVSSALALSAALKKMKKTADVFSTDEISDKLKYLPFSECINKGAEEKYDIAVAIDCGDRGRLGLMAAIYDRADIKMCVDHHKSNALDFDYAFIDPDISSTAEIVFSLIKILGKNLFDKDIASLIYAGILTDSGMFSYPSVTAKTHRIAAELYDYGIDASDIAYNVFKKKTMRTFVLSHTVLSRAKFFCEDRIGIAIFFLKDFEETGASSDNTEGLVNSIQMIDSVKIAVTIIETGWQRFKVSIRTKDPVDASDIAGEFGGGGHKFAAGCRINGQIEEVTERIAKAASDRLP
ncbi:MAG: bifunctional oligoribonuclease/PAP phosphatase NrnA [Clostridiales bacterium]|nr:bifunctional oligoribonuclease/PAP phosphatase NrnA [Clostridiales bacterium]